MDRAQLAALRAKVRTLSERLNELVTATMDVNATEANIMAKAARVQEDWSEVLKVLPGLGRTSMKFDEFLQTVGESVLKAQKSLDKASAYYITDPTSELREEDQHLAPLLEGAPRSFFRIPKVSAEMRFSLEKVGTKEVNLVFYSTSEEAREQHQQTLSFEIVAVPPPADYKPPPADPASRALVPEGPRQGFVATPPAGAASELAPEPAPQNFLEPASATPMGIAHALVREVAPEMATEVSHVLVAPPVVDPSLREEVFALFEHCRAETPAATRALRKGLVRAEQARVLVFASEDRAAFLLILAREGEVPELAAWQLVRDPESLRLLYRLPATAAARQAFASLIRQLAELCDRQQEELLFAER